MAMKAHLTSGSHLRENRLMLARRYYREFYPSCFWHYRPDLTITEDKIPLLVKELRSHGGRRGLLAAAQLTSDECR